MTAIIVTDDSFEQEVIKSEQPVLVDFFAEWCAPCKAMAPALDQVADELRGKVKIVKVDVDQSPNVTDTYGIRSMPTLILFKNGKPSTNHLGALVHKAKLAEWIDGAVDATAPAPAPQSIEFKLTNGLQLLVITKPGAANVVHQMFYRVGTNDDPQGGIGTANFVGTLLSKQGEPVDGAERPSVSADVTYFLQYVKDTLRSAMVREADRMAGLRLAEDEIEAVRQKVIEDLSKREDTPRSRLGWRMYEAEIGGAKVDEISALTRGEMVRFHERYYAPNNAVLTVAGDVNPDEVKHLAEEIYGKIAPRPVVARRSRPAQAPQTIPRRFSETDNAAKHGWFNRNYLVPSYLTALPGEAEALEILATLLARTGLLQQKVVREEKLAKKVFAYYWGHGTGTGHFSLTVLQGNASPEKLEAAVDEVLDAIRTGGVTDAELERAKEVFAAGYRVENEREGALANRYGSSVVCGRSIADVDDWSAAVAKVTAEDIKRVATVFLDPLNSVTGWLISGQADGADSRAA